MCYFTFAMLATKKLLWIGLVCPLFYLRFMHKSAHTFQGQTGHTVTFKCTEGNASLIAY